MLTAVSRLSSTSNSMLCPAAVFVMTWSGIPSFRQGEMWEGKKVLSERLDDVWTLLNTFRSSSLIWDETWMQPSNLLIFHAHNWFPYLTSDIIACKNRSCGPIMKLKIWLHLINDIQSYRCLKGANGWLLVFRSFSGWFSIWPFEKLWRLQTAYAPQIT